MKKFWNLLQDNLQKLSDFCSKNITLNIISSAFMMILPFMIVGSVFSLLQGFNIQAWQALITSNGMHDLFGVPVQFTTNFISIYITFCVGYQFAQKHGLKKQNLNIALTSILSFFLITPYVAGVGYAPGNIPTTYLGSQGMFMAIIVAFMTGGIFKFSIDKNLVITLPEQVPPTISKQFSALIPSFLVVFFFLAIRFAFGLTSYGDAQTALYTIMRGPLMALSSNIWGLYVLQILAMLFWFFGIHGGAVVVPIIMLLFTSLQLENLAAYAAGNPLPNMITGNSIVLGNGSFPLVLCMFLFAKSKSNKSITRVGLIPALFGVDEPSYFGYPMILNPLFFIPWVILTPTLLVWGTYLLQVLHILPYASGASAGNFMPFFVTNFVSYGWVGVIVGCIYLVLGVLIYYPFVKSYDKMQLQKEAEREQHQDTSIA